MFERLKSFFGGSSDHEAMDTGGHAVLAQLDIQAAQLAHENWKVRLQAYLEGRSNEQFSPEVICFDDRCDLGKWIHGEAQQRMGKYPGFTALVGHHKMFHYAASNVVSQYQAGHVEEARKTLDGVFAHHSHAVVESLDLLAQVARSRKH